MNDEDYNIVALSSGWTMDLVAHKLDYEGADYILNEIDPDQITDAPDGFVDNLKKASEYFAKVCAVLENYDPDSEE